MSVSERLKTGWRLMRPFTLAASLVPVLTGTVLARSEGFFHTGVAVAFLAAAILIQAATNMFNEYFDYRRGLDTREMVGIAGAIVRDGLAPGAVLFLAWLFTGTAIALGLYISASSSWWVFATGLASIGVAYLYSGGAVPLAYTPFGELAAGAMMGPVIVGLSYFVHTGRISGTAMILSVPIGVLIGSILLANNIRDLEQDKQGGRRTLAILVGPKRARLFLAFNFALAHLLIVGLVMAKSLSPWALLALLSLPFALKVIVRFARYTEPKLLHPAVKGTALHLMAFGILLIIGMVTAL